ncbi:hypothetical protein CAPTEDRAFT_196016 [Capitella teleta]|uniref:Uncharacterized protein n=1 Tax=Capitella teleta TaxID=283909 RepID=R7VBH1_CAPTE|nr:hypothetical protein CAPTEDRAFT_196016 [Capitella teleta]|eukprot:ELU15907.1 hypothetical protein CAPTEDRAFT_196016 [Capitella teleta]
MAAAIARLLNSDEKDKVNITDLHADYFDEQDEVDVRTVLDNVSDFEDDPTPVNVGECDANAAAAVSALVDHSSDCSSEDHQYVQAMEFRCCCKLFNGSPCYHMFSPKEFVCRRKDMLSLEPREQMLVLLGKISCGINLSDTTNRSRKKGQQERQHQRTNYWMEERSETPLNSFMRMLTPYSICMALIMFVNFAASVKTG